MTAKKKNLNPRCPAMTLAGKPCTNQVMTAFKYCLVHEPSLDYTRKKWNSKGGLAGAQTKRARVLKRHKKVQEEFSGLITMKDIDDYYNKLAVQIAADAIEPNKGRLMLELLEKKRLTIQSRIDNQNGDSSEAESFNLLDKEYQEIVIDTIHFIERMLDDPEDPTGEVMSLFNALNRFVETRIIPNQVEGLVSSN